MQKQLQVPVDEEGDYFSIWELRGVSPQDEERLAYYERSADTGSFGRERFLAGGGMCADSSVVSDQGSWRREGACVYQCRGNG